MNITEKISSQCLNALRISITINPLFISSPFEGGVGGGGGLIEPGGLFERGGALMNLEKMLVSILHKELEYKVEKFKIKKVGGHAAKDQDQI